MILLNGKELANKLYNNIELKGKAKLVVFTVGNDPASKVYVRNKQKACEKVGIEFENVVVDEDMKYCDFEDLIVHILRKDVYSITSTYKHYGMILQLPAPEKFVECFNETVPEIFDVDGFGDKNFKALMTGGLPYNLPATPKGIVTLLNNYNIDVIGKHVVIIGRSNIVGKPLAQMMLNRDATVTICHSKTQNLSEITRTADILIVAAGKPKFINDTHVKDGVVVIDVGINRTPEGICGDVDFDRLKIKCAAITPVPGGVGPMTVYSLVENLINT